MNCDELHFGRRVCNRDGHQAIRFSTAPKLTAGIMLAVMLSFIGDRTSAQCAVTSVSAPAKGQVSFLAPNAKVICASGTVETRSFVGADERTAVEGLIFQLRPNATLTAQTEQSVINNPAIFAGSNSKIYIQGNATLRSTQDNQAAAVISGTSGGIFVLRNGLIEGKGEAINGTADLAKADGWAITNEGVILSNGNTGGPTLRTGTNASVTNKASGIILRTTTTTASSSAFDTTNNLILDAGSTLQNSGLIVLNLGVSDNVGAGKTVEMKAGTSIDNSGTIRMNGETADGRLTGVAIGAIGTSAQVVNQAAGTIDARKGMSALTFSKGSGEVLNRGKIYGGTRDAILSTGEDFRYIQAQGGSVIGDVSARASQRRLKMFSNPALTARCAQANPPLNCFEQVLTHPDKATLEFRTASRLSIDPAVTEFFGFSEIVLTEGGTLALSQDFQRGIVQGPGVNPTGHFRQFLTFDVQKPAGTIELSGAISDAANGAKATVNKTGAGTLRVTGDSTFTGNFSVIGGLVEIDGSLKSPTYVKINGALNGSGQIDAPLVLEAGGRIAANAKTEILTVGSLRTNSGSVIEIDAPEVGGSLTSDRINVKGTARFDPNTLIDVDFTPKSKLPALEGITLIQAENGVIGTAPNVVLDPGSLPGNQNFHLNLDVGNIGVGAVGPGEKIPGGVGQLGYVALQVVNDDPTYVAPPQITVINAPYLVPNAQPVLSPNLVPQLVPTKTVPYLAPVLIKGRTSNVTTPVATNGKTGIKVVNGGVQLGGGTLTPQPQTPGGTQTSPNTIPVGTANAVVVVEPPTDLGTTDFVSIIGSYGKVDQRHARPGTTYRLIYRPHRVDVYKTPTNYGVLGPLGVTQTKTQQQIGKALTLSLPKPHARAKDKDQFNLITALYPLRLGEINTALDSIAGTGADPTFVTVLNSRIFQDAIGSRLGDRRDGTFVPDVTRAGDLGASDRVAWGQIVRRFADGDDYLGGADLNTWGAILGVDQTVAPDVVAGLGLSYADTSVSLDSGANDSVRSLEVGAYGGWTRGDWFVNGSMGVGYHWLDLDRTATLGNQTIGLSGDAGAHSFFAGVEVGRSIATSFGTLEPTAALRYMYVDRSNYTESGSGSLARQVSGETLNSGQGILGLRGYGEYRGSGSTLWRPEVVVGYARELGDTDINETASLVSAPGTSFPVFTAGPGDDVGFLNLRVTATQGGVNFFADYQADVRQDLFSHTVSAGLSLAF